jgi:hypothetical protein
MHWSLYLCLFEALNLGTKKAGVKETPSLTILIPADPIRGWQALPMAAFSESETRDDFITVWGKSLGGAGERNCGNTLSGCRYCELPHKLGGSLNYGSSSGETSRDNNNFLYGQSWRVVHSGRWRIDEVNLNSNNFPGKCFLMVKKAIWALYQLPRCLCTWNWTSSSAMFCPTPKITNQFCSNTSYLSTSYLSVPN